MNTVSVDCPIKDCKEVIVDEVTADLDKMDEREKQELEKQIKARLTKMIKQHHFDGHPKEGK